MKIDGPINYVMLEGKVNNVYKTVEIFFDIHLPLKTLKNTLITYLDQFNDTYDIYIENFVEYKNTFKEPKDGDIYINKLRKELINYKTHRVHHIDIRNILSFGTKDIGTKDIGTKDIGTEVHGIFTLLKDYYNKTTHSIKTLQSILDLATICRSKFQILYETLFHKKYSDTNITELILKLKESYKTPQVKNYVNFELVELHKYFKKCFIILDKLKEYLEKDRGLQTVTDLDLYEHNKKYNYYLFVKDNILKEILDQVGIYIHKIHAINKYINIKIMDLYLIRKLLDKEARSCVIYAGADHCINYIMILVNKFNFVVKKWHYSEFDNVDNIHKAIKKNDFQLTKKLFYPKKLVHQIEIKN